MRFNIFPWRSLKTRVTLLTLATFVIGIWSLTLYEFQAEGQYMLANAMDRYSISDRTPGLARNGQRAAP